MTEAQFKRVTPRGFILMAKEFFEVYVLLKTQYPKDLDHFFAKYYNLCHSYELALKSLLLARDVKIEQLRSKEFGHNLINLLDYFRRKYPDEKVANIDIAVTELVNQHYNAKEFDYPRRGNLHVPEINQLYGLVNRFIVIAEKCIIGTQPRL